MSLQEIELGRLEEYTEFPAQVVLEQKPYLLVLTPEGGFRLLSAICPHAGGDIRPLNEVLFCPLHFWTFDANTGTCLNDPEHRLMQRNVTVRDGRIYAVGEDI